MSPTATIATRQALVAAGWSPGAIKAALRHKRWQRLNEHVVCMHTGPLTAEEIHLAVLASCPATIALAGLTAITVHGVTGFEAPEVHVLVGRGTRVLPVTGVQVVVHKVRLLTPYDVITRRGLAVTKVARSLVDAAVWSCDAHEFLRFCRRHGFPRPELNVRNDASGRHRYLDATFRLADGHVVRVEIDGGVHLTLAQRLRDHRYDNDDVLDQRLTLRFLSIQIYDDDPVAVDQLRRALAFRPNVSA